MIKAGFYHCLWTGCSFKCDHGDEMIKHVAEQHTGPRRY